MLISFFNVTLCSKEGILLYRKYIIIIELSTQRKSLINCILSVPANSGNESNCTSTCTVVEIDNLTPEELLQ